MIYEFNGCRPELRGEGIFIAPGADIIGKVILNQDVGIWFNCTLRGDLEPITIGKGTNVQDGCTIHTDMGKPTMIGDEVTIGHNCVIHGCLIGDQTLVGMGTIILSGAKIGRNCLIGGASLVTGNMDIPDGMLVLGSPAKVIKPLGEGTITRNLANSRNYIERKDSYLAEGLGHPDSSYL